VRFGEQIEVTAWYVLAAAKSHALVMLAASMRGLALPWAATGLAWPGLGVRVYVGRRPARLPPSRPVSH
jgi:hypothetical protein